MGVIGEALRLMARHFLLIAGLVLVVALPAELFVTSLGADPQSAFYEFVRAEKAQFRAGLLVAVILDPLSVGALVYALNEIKRGRAVRFGTALRVGVRNWFPLLVARLVTSLMVVVGFILLIVPGVLLKVRWAFLDECVVLRSAAAGRSSGRIPVGDRARAMSAKLTEGHRGRIFGYACAALFGFFVVVATTVVALGFLPGESMVKWSVTDVLAGCVGRVAYALVHIVIFLLYWDATKDERIAQQEIDVFA